MQAIQEALQRVVKELDSERNQQASVQALEAQVANNRAALREKFLLKLVMGSIAPAEAIERGQELKLDVFATHYLVLFLKIRPQRNSSRYDYYAYQEVCGWPSRKI